MITGSREGGGTGETAVQDRERPQRTKIVAAPVLLARLFPSETRGSSGELPYMTSTEKTQLFGVGAVPELGQKGCKSVHNVLTSYMDGLRVAAWLR